MLVPPTTLARNAQPSRRSAQIDLLPEHYEQGEGLIVVDQDYVTFGRQQVEWAIFNGVALIRVEELTVFRNMLGINNGEDEGSTDDLSDSPGLSGLRSDY